MIWIGRTRFAALICVVMPATVLSQALPSLASRRVAYNTRKATVRPQRALKLRIDSVDAAIADATRQGRTGEMRRLIANGGTLLVGRQSTDALDFGRSLVLRSDRVVTDPAKPYVVRLEQIYAPSIQRPPELVATASLQRRAVPAVVKESAAVAGVRRDLRESSQIFALDLTGVPDGDYQLSLDVSNATVPPGSADLSIHAHTGPADPVAKRNGKLSEDDVMRVLGLMRRQYQIDDSRIYLRGHSMGAIGTWKIAPKYPDLWAAIAPLAGSGMPATLERVRSIPSFVVHGDGDATVNVEGSRRMVATMKELNMEVQYVEVQYVEVPGGTHGGVVAANALAMFDCFDAHRKNGATSSR